MSSTYVDGTTPLDAAHMNALQQKVEKGLANGYASLDSGVKVPVSQLPAGTASGVASLDSGGKVPVAQLPTTLLPGAEIGYDQITAAVTVASTTEASGTTVIACAAHVFDGAAVIAEFFAQNVLPAAAANALIVVGLFEGATQIGRFGLVQSPNIASGIQVPFYGRYRFTPSAGSHTYTVTAWQSGGNGTIQAGAGGAGANSPAFARFTKV